MKIIQLNFKDLLTLLTSLKKTNKLFSVVNITQDGRERLYVCRFGVKKYLSQNPYKKILPYNPNIITIYDTRVINSAKAYRSINIHTIKNIKVDGVKYEYIKSRD